MADYVTDEFMEKAPEAALLLLTARPLVGPRAIEKIRSVLDRQIRWDLMLRMAHHHGVASLACRGLVSVGPEAVPAAALQAFRVAAQATALQDRFLADELIKVLKLCEARGLDVIPVKGPTLAHSVYGGRGLRPSRDLDILVREQDVPRVTEVLLEEGFEILKPSTFSSARRDDFRRFHEITFGKADEGVYVEVQWAMGNARFHSRIKFNEYWDRHETVVFDQVAVKGLLREDLLVILCEHATKHLWNRLKWTCDIAELVCGGEGLDWDDVFERARAAGAARAILVGLALSRNLLGSVLPPSVASRVSADPAVASLAGQVARRMFSARADNFGVFSWQKCLFHARSRELLSDKMRHGERFLHFLASPIGQDDGSHTWKSSSSNFLLLPWRMIRRAGRHHRARMRSRPVSAGRIQVQP